MKNDEVTAGHLSPCVRIFIESLLNADLTTDAARDTGTTENSMDIKNLKNGVPLATVPDGGPDS